MSKFFRHSTNSMNDDRLAVFVREYGGDGYAFYFMHLEYMARKPGLALGVKDTVFRKLIVGKMQVTPERYDEMLRAALNLGLFDAKRYGETGELSCDGLKVYETTNRGIKVL